MPKIKFWVRKISNEDDYNVFIEADSKRACYHLDPEDGYRSSAHEEELLVPWNRAIAGLQIHYVSYDISIRDVDMKDQSIHYLFRAFRLGKEVFAIGTEYADDYYPGYFFNIKGEDFEDYLKPPKSLYPKRSEIWKINPSRR